MNNNIIKTVGLYVIAGTATAAGTALWSNVLQEKIVNAIDKRRKSKKIIKVNFKKGLSR